MLLKIRHSCTTCLYTGSLYNYISFAGRAGEATLMTALNLTEALAAEGTKVAQPSSRGGSTAREPAVHSKGNCPDDGVLETEKQELPCSDAADRQVPQYEYPLLSREASTTVLSTQIPCIALPKPP